MFTAIWVSAFPPLMPLYGQLPLLSDVADASFFSDTDCLSAFLNPVGFPRKQTGKMFFFKYYFFSLFL